jgi:hypothetical protein
MSAEPKIPTPSYSPGTRWAIVVAIPTQPYCPRCGRALRDEATEFVYDVAWCSQCAAAPYRELFDIGLLLRKAPLQRHTCWHHHLVFWAPRAYALAAEPVYDVLSRPHLRAFL